MAYAPCNLQAEAERSFSRTPQWTEAAAWEGQQTDVDLDPEAAEGFLQGSARGLFACERPQRATPRQGTPRGRRSWQSLALPAGLVCVCVLVGVAAFVRQEPSGLSAPRVRTVTKVAIKTNNLAEDAGSRESRSDRGEEASTTSTRATTQTPYHFQGPSCHTSVPGEPCHFSVHWAMNTGIFMHPEWYAGLSPESSFDEFQLCLYLMRATNCSFAPPCGVKVVFEETGKKVHRESHEGAEAEAHRNEKEEEEEEKTKTEEHSNDDGDDETKSSRTPRDAHHGKAHARTRNVTSTRTSTSTRTQTSTSTRTATPTTTSTRTTTATLPRGPEPLLFCWSHMELGSDEEALIHMQLKRRSSIFACNDYAVISSNKSVLGRVNGSKVETWYNPEKTSGFGKNGVNGQTTDSFLNTQTFIQAWDTLMNSGQLWAFDFVVKVDPDAVFFPDRLRKRMKDHVGEAVYVPNCGKWGGKPLMYGSLEVFSVPALKKYAERVEDCKALNWQGWGEDYYMQHCMDMLGVQAVPDFDQVGDERCLGAPCSDWTKIAFHDFKKPKDWLDCFKEAIAR